MSIIYVVNVAKGTKNSTVILQNETEFHKFIRHLQNNCSGIAISGSIVNTSTAVTASQAIAGIRDFLQI